MKPARKALSKKVNKPSTRSTRRESSLLPPFGFCVAPCHACHSPCCPVFQWGSGTNNVRVPVTSKLLPPTRTSAHWVLIVSSKLCFLTLNRATWVQWTHLQVQKAVIRIL